MTIIVQESVVSPIAAPTLSYLADQIGRWLNRTDLGQVVSGFIRMAEEEFSRDVRLRSCFMVAQKTGSTTNGALSMPDDMLELKELRFEGETLKEILYGDFEKTTARNVFARVGNLVKIAGAPAGDYELTYVQKLTRLIFDADSNWLLREHFDVYLYKCCEIGSIWLRDPEGAQGYSTKYEAAAQKLLEAVNYHGYSAAPLEVMARGVV